MNKFYQIPTDTFIPVSHDNSYLFNHYEKVANFLAFNLEKNYKNILAKPVQNNYNIDWFSPYDNLANINEKSNEETQIGLVAYWGFIDVINAKISQLSTSSDDNSKNWASLLTKVFNDKDNVIFSDGRDICIVWGWKFENTENYKSNIALKSKDITLSQPPSDSVPKNETPEKPSISLAKDEKFVAEDTIEENPLEKVKIDEIPPKEIPEDLLPEESSFLKFLKWFASKFWWLLMLLLLLIIFSLLLKSCNNNDNDINFKLNQLEEKANKCCN